MSVAVFPLGPLETNCYIVSNEGHLLQLMSAETPLP